MIPYAVKAGYISTQLLSDLELARHFFTHLPGDHHTCHGVCRVAQQFLTGRWHVEDGFFLGHDHCWLWTDDEKRGFFILDVYPVAAASGPLLIDAGSGWRRAYRASPKPIQQDRTYELEADMIWEQWRKVAVGVIRRALKNRHGSLQKFAAHHSLSAVKVQQFLNGKQPLTSRVRDALTSVMSRMYPWGNLTVIIFLQSRYEASPVPQE